MRPNCISAHNDVQHIPRHNDCEWEHRLPCRTGSPKQPTGCAQGAVPLQLVRLFYRQKLRIRIKALRSRSEECDASDWIGQRYVTSRPNGYGADQANSLIFGDTRFRRLWRATHLSPNRLPEMWRTKHVGVVAPGYRQPVIVPVPEATLRLKVEGRMASIHRAGSL